MELWLFPLAFPFGTSEAFLESEIPVLCKRFERVRIFPLKHPDGVRPLPPNADVSLVLTDLYRQASMAELLTHPGLVLDLLSSAWRDAPDSAAFRSAWPEVRSIIPALVHRALCIQRELDATNKEVLLYAYWMHDPATVITLVERKGKRLKRVSRAHRFDLHHDRTTRGWLPFRSLQLKRLDRVFCVSRHGADYLKRTHPSFAPRVEVSLLGTVDRGTGPWAPPTGPLRLVSCSYLVKVKRVDLLIEVLRRVRIPVQWTHFGHGPEAERIQALAATLPAHITADLRGEVPNTEILARYADTPFDLFIHLSEHEGLPVALMEAASFGLPLMACDVGGVGELVNAHTGTLLPEAIDPAVVATLVEQHLNGPMNTAAFREQVRAYWQANFQAERNFEQFCDRLDRI